MSARDRSVGPGARNHGAMTTLSGAPAAQPSAASAGDGPGRVANAVVAPAHWVPAISFGATRAVRALAAGCDRADRHHEHAHAAVERADPQLDEPLTQHRRPADRLRRARRPAAPGDWRRSAAIWRGDVDAGMVGVGQQERSHDGCCGTPLSTSTRCGVFSSQKASRASRPGRMRATRPATARALAADRGSLLPWAVSTSTVIGAALPASGRCPHLIASLCIVAGAGHDACSPHSVLDSPCQRPLRGSAPSTTFAVQGAHPIDG